MHRKEHHSSSALQAWFAHPDGNDARSAIINKNYKGGQISITDILFHLVLHTETLVIRSIDSD